MKRKGIRIGFKIVNSVLVGAGVFALVLMGWSRFEWVGDTAYCVAKLAGAFVGGMNWGLIRRRNEVCEI